MVKSRGLNHINLNVSDRPADGLPRLLSRTRRDHALPGREGRADPLDLPHALVELLRAAEPEGDPHELPISIT